MDYPGPGKDLPDRRLAGAVVSVAEIAWFVRSCPRSTRGTTVRAMGGRSQPAWTGTGPGGLGAEAMIANGIAMRRSNPVRSADFYVRRPTVRYATKVAVS